ncbi:hypothetical protein GCM10007857_40660 [Bradyrhizobium iriomotense]|uniref:Uncharacterized protein n=1 Tax=Bradyrhizobium iriomotense TaxID=441950 RepID=A0ABQ6B391_9BRAD|nr:hypothetical protein GCM10007857_40660 [Bradyrhizobium iriomotense]
MLAGFGDGGSDVAGHVASPVILLFVALREAIISTAFPVNFVRTGARIARCGVLTPKRKSPRD